MAYCELCDLPFAMCDHGAAAKRASAAEGISTLLISPTNMAHLPHCPHKGDDPDLSQWGTLSVPNAWARLGNGEHLPATGGERPDRIAMGRCKDCVDHGPW